MTGVATIAWGLAGGVLRLVLVVAAVGGVAVIWTVFAVPDDPSRSGNAPVPVPGIVRLGLEWLVLFGGAMAFYASGQAWIGLVLAVLVIVHYALWPERIRWLLRR